MADRNYPNHQNQNQNQNQQQQIKEINKPFIGPRPFSQNPEDQKLFFGRNYESEKIISLIYSHKLVLVYAQSGAGKTSLFNAQIVPELEKKGLQVLPIARVGIGSDLTDKLTTINLEKSDNDGIDSNDSNLYLLNAFQSLVPTISDHSTLKNQSLSTFLKVYFPHQRNQRGKDIPQVLVFDQLEEIFNLFSDPNKWQEHQKDFFSNVADALENDPLLRIIFVIREDYLAQLDPFVSILPENLKPRFRLERLRKDEAIQAIKGPLERLNYDVPLDEIEQIVQDLMKIKVETITGKSLEVIGDFIEPIHLQVVCQRWWNERFISKDTTKPKSNLLSLDLTNVDKALEDFYVKSIHAAVRKNRVKEEDIRKWCEENLITSSGTRSNIHLEANVTKGIPNRAIEILSEQYLIRREWRAGAYWYELTHDRLIGPIKESNKKWNEKKQKSKRAFRIKVFVPIILISIISISLAVLAVSSNIQEELEQQRQIITQQQEDINQLTRGINLYGQGRYKEASAEFDKVLSINPNHTEALYYKGLTLEDLSKSDKDLSKLDQALQYYDKALEIDPTHSSALFQKAYVLDDQKKYAEAIDYWDKTLDIDPNDVDALNNKGLSLKNLGKYEEAITWYDKALAVDPKYTYALNNKGSALDSLGKYEEAITWYDKALAIDPKYVSALNNKGDVFYNQQKYNEALQYYNRTLEVDPSNTYALYSKGYVFYDQQKYDDALQYYNKALDIDPKYVDALHDKGSALYYLKQYEEAIALYDKVLAIDPNYLDALKNKAIILSSLGQEEEAIALYDKVLAIDSNYLDALNGKAFGLAKIDKNEEALPLIQKALESNSDNEYYLSTAALIMYNLGKYDDAKSYFEKALQINPNLKDILEGKEITAFNELINNNTKQ